MQLAATKGWPRENCGTQTGSDPGQRDRAELGPTARAGGILWGERPECPAGSGCLYPPPSNHSAHFSGEETEAPQQKGVEPRLEPTSGAEQ